MRDALRLIVDHDLMPHPRLIQNKKALRMARIRGGAKGSVKRTLEYFTNRDDLAWLLKSVAQGRKFPAGVRLRADITVWLAHNRLPDKDNLEKTALDALVVAGILDDDRWVRAGDTIVHDGCPQGMVTVAIIRLT